MNVMFGLGHPAHFHFFYPIIKQLQCNGHSVSIVITDKDILRNLLEINHCPYHILSLREHKENMMHKATKILRATIKLLPIVNSEKPDIMLGSLSPMAYISKLKHIPFMFCGEDDIDYTRVQYNITAPFSTNILAPLPTKVGKYKRKKIAYNGYQKLTYLHPNSFTPDSSILEASGIIGNFSLIRLVSLSAYHDTDINGIGKETLLKIIDKLSAIGKVFISSEKELPKELAQYQLPIALNDIHHALYYASLYIGDSQSMAVEAAMLGTPSIRFNDFAGRISVLEELEHTYGLTFGIHSSQPTKLLEKIDELLSIDNLRDEFQRRRNLMLNDKIDVAAFFIWFIENYPQSRDTMLNDPDYQFRFRTKNEISSH